jgi:hypothetical protein
MNLAQVVTLNIGEVKPSLLRMASRPLLIAGICHCAGNPAGPYMHHDVITIAVVITPLTV